MAGRDETGEVVDVPVGLVEVDAARQPDDLLDTEVLAQVPLDFFLRQLGVAVAVEQALCSGEQGALPVDVDGAALEDEVGCVDRCAFKVEHLAADEVVGVPGEVQPHREATPCVELPVDAAYFVAVVDQEGRSAVSDPRVVRAHLDHADSVREHRSGVLVLPR